MYYAAIHTHVYVGKFIQWANEQDKLDLSNNTPLELINGLKKMRKKNGLYWMKKSLQIGLSKKAKG